MEPTTETYMVSKTQLVNQELTTNLTVHDKKEAAEDNCPQNPKCFDEMRPDFHENFDGLPLKVERDQSQQGTTCLDRVSQDESEPVTAFSGSSIVAPPIETKQDEECNPGKQDDVLRNSKPGFGKREAYDKLSEPCRQPELREHGVQDAGKSQDGLVVDTCDNQATDLIQQPGARVKRFVCSICKYAVAEKDCFTRHMKEHHKSTVQRRSTCQEMENMPVKHRADVPLYSCTLCGYTAEDRENLSRHVTKHHNEHGRWLHCPHCYYYSYSKYYLARHLKDKHDPHVKLFKCTACDFETKYGRCLRTHESIQHSSEAPLYQCAECDFRTKWKAALARHVISKHTSNGLVYPRGECNFTAKFKGELTRHVSVKHDPDAPEHGCVKCGFTTKTKSSLSCHMQTHLNEHDELHECPHCDLVTTNKGAMTLHLRAKHDPDAIKYECKFCGFVSKARWALEMHLAQKQCHLSSIVIT